MFYRGEMAEVIAREMAEGGGIITKKDLAPYKTIFYDQLTNISAEIVMYGAPPPSSFAVTHLIVSVMSAMYPEGHEADIRNDPKVIHHFVEAMKCAYVQRRAIEETFRTLLGDSAFVSSVLELGRNMTTKEHTRWIVRRMRDVAQPATYYGGINLTQVPDHATSQVSVLDEYGNGVLATTTINR
ncbi:hypothetical protein ANCDUO_05302 [Ancylostoma duodenale]|uniref:Gamma-glutamyltranspeptidase n=1 Tax=Ancylostoma duodenale TaxID=51022 RepID=A0A0C2GZ08_9BILA|nr:hypothetical protein ANCDUO_05302 [Ancylostoma duodenale]